MNLHQSASSFEVQKCHKGKEPFCGDSEADVHGDLEVDWGGI